MKEKNVYYTEYLIHNLYPANTPLRKPDHACTLLEYDGVQISHAINKLERVNIRSYHKREKKKPYHKIHHPSIA